MLAAELRKQPIVKQAAALVLVLALGGCSSRASDVTLSRAQPGTLVRSNVAYALAAVPPDAGATIDFGFVSTPAGTVVTFSGESTMSTPKFPEPTQLVTYTFAFSANVTTDRSPPRFTVALAGASDAARYVLMLTDTTSGRAMAKITATSYENGTLVFPTFETSLGITFLADHVYALALAQTTVVDLPPPSI